MIIPEILKYVKGYLTLRVDGLNIERFFNMSMAGGIELWDIKRVNTTEVQMKVSIRGYRALKKILRKTGCRVSIIDKNGLPFFIAKVNRRKMLGFGLLIFLLLIIAMSSFVWSVKVVGAKNSNTQDLERNLAELGVKPGAFKLSIPVAEVENNMLIKMGNLSWIKVRLIGTRAYVEVKERVLPPEILPDSKPCNIVAKRDGVITKIVSQKGDVKAISGDTVSKGQVLITGVLERENMDKRYVHASGQAIAKTWYQWSTAVPLQKYEKVRTGRCSSKIYIKWYDKRVLIKNTNIKYKNYDKIEKSTKIIDMDNFQFPLEIAIEQYFETTANRVTLTPEDAKSEAISKMEKFIIDNMSPDAKIIDKKVDIAVEGNIAYASALIETIEDIGTQEEININGEV